MEDNNNIYKTLEKIGEDIIKQMGDIIKKNGAVATGRLLNSLDYEVKFSEKGVWELLIEYADYGVFVDKGRNPGRFPPGPAIKEWMRIKGIPADAFWPIMQKIKKAGYYSKMVGGVPLSPPRGIRFTDPFNYNVNLKKITEEFGKEYVKAVEKQIVIK